MGIADPGFGRIEVERLRAGLESAHREIEAQTTKYLENLGACADIQGRTTDKLHAAEAVIATLPTPEQLDSAADEVAACCVFGSRRDTLCADHDVIVTKLRAVAAALREHRNG